MPARRPTRAAHLFLTNFAGPPELLRWRPAITTLRWVLAARGRRGTAPPPPALPAASSPSFAPRLPAAELESCSAEGASHKHSVAEKGAKSRRKRAVLFFTPPPRNEATTDQQHAATSTRPPPGKSATSAPVAVVGAPWLLLLSDVVSGDDAGAAGRSSCSAARASPRRPPLCHLPPVLLAAVLQHIRKKLPAPAPFIPRCDATAVVTCTKACAQPPALLKAGRLPPLHGSSASRQQLIARSIPSESCPHQNSCCCFDCRLRRVCAPHKPLCLCLRKGLAPGSQTARERLETFLLRRKGKRQQQVCSNSRTRRA